RRRHTRCLSDWSQTCALPISCGITTSGAAFCWGDNLFGELGNNDGSTTKRTTPVAVFGGLTFSAISANEYYTCGIKTGGAAYCRSEERRVGEAWRMRWGVGRE